MLMFDQIDVKIHKATSSAVLPTRATAGSAGFDLYADIQESLRLEPGDRATISTGVAVSIGDQGAVGLVFSRSGLGVRHGVSLANGVGVIDSDYRGEIFVGLNNSGAEAYTINPGDRIAQLLFVPAFSARFVEVDSLDATDRGKGGFGSTGR